MGEIFDDMRRSRGSIRLANIKGSNLLTEEEFSQFSAATRGCVEVILGIYRGDG
jgi:hypothetical protein